MQGLSRRELLAAAAAAALPLGAARAQSFPNKPVRLIAVNPPGGLTDTVSRIFSPRLQALLGQTVLVENKPGANGGVGASTLASLPADGHSFLVADGSMLTVNPLLSQKLAYDPVKDFAPVALMGQAPLFLVVNPKLGVNTLDELVQLAKSKPGRLNYGSSGLGSTHHLTMEALKASLGLFITHIPFRGSAASVPAMLAGEVEMVFAAYPSIAGFLKSGQAKAIAVNSARRWPQEPNVPAIAEKIPGFDYAPNVIVLARAGTPAEAIQRVSNDIATVAKQPDAVEAARAQGVQLIGGGPAQLSAALQKETVQMRETAKRASLKAE
ncbi:MAG TPA: tripartite tricarboxylate transporter substrate binding protein [Ramlibacter sp.]|jgi:tripartite-type tricarboxylate transporter receptor subunit TctC|nr:tripartite tricarboxylate transporter substrate binding protein [Ramlibacter sp.]